MNRRRVLFVDIDSVLNHSLEAESLYDAKFGDAEFAALVEDKVPLCKDNIEALKHIVDNVSDLAIVWSTDWRLAEDDVWNGWKNPLKWLESQVWLKDKIIGKTPKKMSSTRFEEIHFWFHENNLASRFEDKVWMNKEAYDIANYAIIDDYDSYGMQRYGKHFFKCDWKTGLTMQQANELVKYIMTNDFKIEELDWSNKK